MLDAGTSGVWGVTMEFCPADPVLGIPMYQTPCRFPRYEFQETLSAGFWPDGAVFEYAAVYRGARSRWRVRGNTLLEIDGARVIVGRLGRGARWEVSLIELLAAKGVT